VLEEVEAEAVFSGGQITDSAPVVESDSSNNSNNGSTSDQPNILLIIAGDAFRRPAKHWTGNN
jgi:hypothetical protein